MILKPDISVDTIVDITIDMLQENGIEAIFLDIDNTLMTYSGKILEGAREWIDNIKQNDIQICLLSNNFSKKRMQKIKDELGIEEGITFACKPLNIGINKARKIIENKKVAIIGDSFYTDVLGGKFNKIFSIKTKKIKIDKENKEE